MRKRLGAMLAFLLGVTVAIPLAVLAAPKAGGGEGGLNHQAYLFREGKNTVSTSSKDFGAHAIPGLIRRTCSRGPVAVTISVNITGAPADFQVLIDEGKSMEPRRAHFSPVGTTAFSYTFVDSVGPFEASDGHAYSVHWRSPTGGKVTLHRADMLVQYRDPHTCA